MTKKNSAAIEKTDPSISIDEMTSLKKRTGTYSNVFDVAVNPENGSIYVKSRGCPAILTAIGVLIVVIVGSYWLVSLPQPKAYPVQPPSIEKSEKGAQK